jgi:hypothetical protein
MDRSTKQVDVTIGLDLGDRRSQAAVLDAGGVLIEERSVATTKEGMAEVFGQYGGCRIVMEVGTHSPWVSRLFKERGFEVIVANPRQVRLIAASQRKTDRYDAQMLARLGRLDPALLAPVQHRGVEAQQHRAMMQRAMDCAQSLLISQVADWPRRWGYGCRAAGSAFACKCVRPWATSRFSVDTLLSTSSTQQRHRPWTNKSRTDQRTYPEAASAAGVGRGPIVVVHLTGSAFRQSRVVGAYLCPAAQLR